MPKKKVINITVGIVVILLFGFLLYFGTKVYPKLKIGKEISDLLQPILTEENQTMHMDISAEFAGEPFILDSDIYMVKEDEQQYLVLEQMDFPVYIVDDLLLLENGNAFQLAKQTESQSPTYDNLFVQIAAAYEVLDITCVKTDYEANYSVYVTGEQVQELLAKVMPADAKQFNSIEKLQLVMVAQNGRLDRIEMTGKAEVNGKSVQVEVLFSEFRTLEAGVYEIPETVKQTVKTVDRDTLLNLTEDLYRLLVAFEQFQKKESRDGTVTLHANCGLINFTNKFDLATFQQNETTSMNTEEIHNLPAMIAVLCMEGEIRCIESEEGFEYTLSLDEESMQKITEMVIPEVVNYVMQLTDGVAKVMVVENSILSIEITIKGNVNILITKVPMEVGVKFQYE